MDPESRRRPAGAPNTRYDPQPSRGWIEGSRRGDARTAPTPALCAARGAGPYRLRRLAIADSLRTLARGGGPPRPRGSRALVEETIINSLGGLQQLPES